MGRRCEEAHCPVDGKASTLFRVPMPRCRNCASPLPGKRLVPGKRPCRCFGETNQGLPLTTLRNPKTAHMPGWSQSESWEPCQDKAMRVTRPAARAEEPGGMCQQKCTYVYQYIMYACVYLYKYIVYSSVFVLQDACQHSIYPPFQPHGDRHL